MLRGLIFFFSCLSVLLIAVHLEFVWGVVEHWQESWYVFFGIMLAFVATYVAVVCTQFVKGKIHLRSHIYGGVASASVMLMAAKFLPTSSGIGLILLCTAVAGAIGATVTWLPDARRAVPQRQ